MKTTKIFNDTKKYHLNSILVCETKEDNDFGASTAISSDGQFMAISAPGERLNISKSKQDFVPTFIIENNIHITQSQFNSSIDQSQNFNKDSSGVVHILIRQDTNWNTLAMLVPKDIDKSKFTRFGECVAISDNLNHIAATSYKHGKDDEILGVVLHVYRPNPVGNSWYLDSIVDIKDADESKSIDIKNVKINISGDSNTLMVILTNTAKVFYFTKVDPNEDNNECNEYLQPVWNPQYKRWEQRIQQPNFWQAPYPQRMWPTQQPNPMRYFGLEPEQHRF